MAIMFFENMADPEDEGNIAPIVTSALNTDLGESEYIRVLSEQRQHDILKELGKEDLKLLDRSVAAEVAKRAGVNWIVTGKILRLEPNYVLTSQIEHAITGELRKTQRVQGEAGEDLFNVIDKLTGEIRMDLSLPEEAGEEPDRAVADITTHSIEAYRYYLEGINHFYGFRMDRAVERFCKALEYDSTYARAYFRIAMATLPSHAPGFDQAIAKAAEYSDRVPEMERQFIKSMASLNIEGVDSTVDGLERLTERFPEEKEPHYWLGIFYAHFLQQPEKAIRHFERALELDPNYAIAYNDITVPYLELGDFEKALWAINQYIFLSPNDANPHDTKGIMLGEMGELDKAIESFQRALDIDSTFYSSSEYLGYMYIFKRNYEEAKAILQKMLSSTDKLFRSAGRCDLTRIPMYQGRLDDALNALTHAIAEDMREQATGEFLSQKYVLWAMIYHEKGELDLALEEFDKAIDIYRRDYPDDRMRTEIWYRDFQVQVLVEKGDVTRAQEIADGLRTAIEESGRQRYEYWHAAGLLAYARGDLEASLTTFVRAAEVRKGFWPRYTLAKTYMELNRPNEAIPILEAALSRYDGAWLPEQRLSNPIVAVKAYYLLGLAYEKSGSSDKAIANYEEFLEIWRNADKELQLEVADARQRLNRLKSRM